MKFEFMDDQVALIRVALEAMDREAKDRLKAVGHDAAPEFAIYSIEALLVDIEQQEAAQ